MKKIVSAALLTLAMGGVCAQGYVGANFGMTHINADCKGYTTCDNSDTGFKILGGFKVNPNVAIELSYLDFGKVQATWGINTYKVEVDAVALAAALRGDLAPKLSGVARLGLASVDTKGSVSNAFAGSSGSENKVKAYLGLGLEYAFDKQVKGVLDADFTNAERNGQTASVRMLSIGVQYSF